MPPGTHVLQKILKRLVILHACAQKGQTTEQTSTRGSVFVSAPIFSSPRSIASE
jgi:hypothetical protein